MNNECIFWKIPSAMVEVRMQDVHQLRPLESYAVGVCLQWKINKLLPEINMSGLFPHGETRGELA